MSRRAQVKRGKLLRDIRSEGSWKWMFGIEENDQRNPSFLYIYAHEIKQGRKCWRKMKRLLTQLKRTWPYGLAG